MISKVHLHIEIVTSGLAIRSGPLAEDQEVQEERVHTDQLCKTHTHLSPWRDEWWEPSHNFYTSELVLNADAQKSRFLFHTETYFQPF